MKKAKAAKNYTDLPESQGRRGDARTMDNGSMRKKKMMDKSRVLFRKKGYHGTSMKELAEAFGCKPANIYNYFKNKEELLFEVLLEEMEQIIDPVAHLEHAEITDPLEQIQFLIINHIRVTLGFRRSARMLFDTELGHLSPSKRRVIIGMRKQYDRILCRLIELGIARGDFRPTNVKLAAYSIASMVARSRVWYSPKGDLTPDEIGEFIFEFAVSALKGNQSLATGL